MFTHFHCFYQISFIFKFHIKPSRQYSQLENSLIPSFSHPCAPSNQRFPKILANISIFQIIFPATSDCFINLILTVIIGINRFLNFFNSFIYLNCELNILPPIILFRFLDNLMLPAYAAAILQIPSSIIQLITYSSNSIDLSHSNIYFFHILLLSLINSKYFPI